jgi:gluconolactonase
MTKSEKSPSLLGRLLAELGVIVLGVLIALWADGWVSDRAERRVEASRIEALRDNIDGTRARLVDARAEADDADAALREIVTWADPDQAVRDAGVVLRGLFFGPVFAPELNVYTDLKNSGDLALLRNAGLRQALAKMEASFDRLFLLQSDLVAVQQLRYDPYVLSEFSLSETLGPYVLGLDDLPRDPSPTPNMRELRNLALFKLDLVTQLRRAYDDVDSALDEVEQQMGGTSAASEQADTPRVVSLAPAFDSLVTPGTPIEVLSEGHGWTEGPVWAPELGGLLYSDIPANTIFLHRDGEGVTEWLEPSGASNGLILDEDGALLLAQHGDRRIARLLAPWTAPEPVFETLAENYDAVRFNSPNDLVLGPGGDLYFTDPPYGLAGGDEDPAKELTINGVYRRTPDGSVELVDDEIVRPNGVALSPDAHTLYVASSDARQPYVFAYPVAEDGSVGARSRFAESMGDGMAIDRDGNVWVAEPASGVYVFDSDGRHLGSILTGRRTANVAWGDDGSTLYITAASHLMRIRTQVVGTGF